MALEWPVATRRRSGCEVRPIGWVGSPLVDRVRNLEALDGTPILDVKPVLEPRGER